MADVRPTQDEIWSAGDSRVKVLCVSGDRVTLERTAGAPNHVLHRTFICSIAQLNAAFTLDAARTKAGSP